VYVEYVADHAVAPGPPLVIMLDTLDRTFPVSLTFTSGSIFRSGPLQVIDGGLVPPASGDYVIGSGGADVSVFGTPEPASVPPGDLERTQVIYAGSKVTSPQEASAGTSPSVGFGGVISPHNGEVVLRLPLLSVPRVGFDWEFALTYRSQVEYVTGPVGNSWDHGYNVRLERLANGDLLLRDGDGRVDRYERREDAAGKVTYLSPPGRYDTLAAEGDGWAITDRHGSSLHFLPAKLQRSRQEKTRYLLQRLADRYGNEMRFTYDTADRLIEVIDSAGWPARYGYTGRRLTSVTDPLGREIRLRYYEEGDIGGSPGDLRSVTIFVALGNEELNQEADYPSYLFEYHRPPAGGDPRLAHNLVAVYDPKGVRAEAVGAFSVEKRTGAAAFMTFVYGLAGAGLDKVESQTFGESGRSVYALAYATDAGMAQTTVTDPNGSRIEYLFRSPASPLDEVAAATPATVTLLEETVLDALGPPVSTVAADLTESYRYNADGEVERHRRPAGNGAYFYFEPDFDIATLASRTPAPTAEERRANPRRGNLVAVVQVGSAADQPPSAVQTVYTSPPHEATCLVRTFQYNEWSDVEWEIDPRDNASATPALPPASTYSTTHQFDGQGNAIGTTFPVVTRGQPGGQPQGASIARTFTPEGQLASETDALGGRTFYFYYPKSAGGYLKCVARGFAAGDPDPNPDGRTSASPPSREYPRTFENFVYDDAGNVIEHTDGRGTVTAFQRDRLGRVTMETRAVGPLTEKYCNFKRWYGYDGCGNGVAEDIEYRLPEGEGPHLRSLCQTLGLGFEHVLAEDTVLFVRREFSVIGQVCRERVDIAPGYSARTRYEYDFNGNLTQVTDPEDRITTFSYTRRGLRSGVSLGAGALQRLVERTVYDANGNPVRVENGAGEGTISTFDRLDRPYEERDVLGAKRTLALDVAGNLEYAEVRGAPGGAHSLWGDVSGLHDELLQRTDYSYDERDRCYEEVVSLTSRGGEGVAAGATIETTRLFDAGSQVVSTTDDRGFGSTVSYDAIGRVLSQTDALANEVRFEWDGEGELLTQIEVEREGAASFTYTTVFERDRLGRLTCLQEPSGARTRYRYDSLGNTVLTSDPLGQEGGEGFGNLTVCAYDGLGNRVLEARYASEFGRGSGAEDFTAAGAVLGVKRSFDRSGLLRRAVDAKGRYTGYDYDDYGRLVAVTEGEGSGPSITRASVEEFDAADRPTQVCDRNGTRAVTVYAGGRPVARSYTPGTDFAVRAGGGDPLAHEIYGVKNESYEWNALGLCTYAQETGAYPSRGGAPPLATSVEVRRGFDSLGRLVREETTVDDGGQPAWPRVQTTVREYGRSGGTDLARTRFAITSPGAAGTTYHELAYTYDKLLRPSEYRADGQHLLSLEYRGPGRLLTESFSKDGAGPRITTTYDYAGDASGGHARHRLPTKVEHKVGGVVVAVHGRTRDEAKRPTLIADSRRGLGASGNLTDRISFARYDSLGRLKSVSWSGTDVVAGPFVADRDEVGNLTRFESPLVPEYTLGHGFFNQPTDIGGEATTVSRSGSLLFDGVRRLSYDAKERLVAVERMYEGSEELVARYLYDPFGRRVGKIIYGSAGDPSDWHRYTFDGSRCVEDAMFLFLGFPCDLHTYYTHRLGPGGPIARTAIDGLEFYLSTPEQSVVALVHVSNSTGEARCVERYETDAIGWAQRFFLMGNSEMLDRPPSTSTNPYFHAGQWQEQETEIVEGEEVLRQALFNYGRRHYCLETAAFLQRDSLGAWGDPLALGNAYMPAAGNQLMYGDDGNMAWLIVLGFGIWGGMEAAGWTASSITGDPGLEVAPSQQLWHGLRGQSIYGGSRGFQTGHYSGLDRLAEGVRGGTAIAAPWLVALQAPRALLAADAGLNIGLGAYDTAQGHTIMGPLQMALGAVGLAGLRGMRAPRGGQGIGAVGGQSSAPSIDMPTLMRTLRRIGTPEAHATAKLIKRGLVDVRFVRSLPPGYGGMATPGSNVVRIVGRGLPDEVAGLVAHEARHVMQRVTPQTYNIGHEFEAYQWSRAVDRTFPHKTDDAIWSFLRQEPRYADRRLWTRYFLKKLGL
jgi:YD repeat-containing protein